MNANTTHANCMKTLPHTLLATTGASPQVITETLYAIHQINALWPDKVILITTSFGKRKAVEGLLEKGHLQRLCRQLQRPLPAFDIDDVLVAPGADGQPMEDARSTDDHEALANFIMTKVRDYTQGGQGSLHASLAGGRKTMTFYIGYAMSLFGRVQDTLSHVLVSEGYENIPDFWFPTLEESHRYVQNRDTTLDASLAQVTLAPIPFVRHRHNLPQVLLQTHSDVNFAQLVQLINLGENPDTLRLQVDLPKRCIRLTTADSNLRLEFEPGLLELAFFTLMARCTLSGESDLTRPLTEKPEIGLSASLLQELLPLCNRPCKESLKDNLDELEDWNTFQAQARERIKDSTLETLRTGISSTWFDQRKNQLGALFAQQLPANLVRWVQPSTIWGEDGHRLGPESIDKVTKKGGYGIYLQPHQISIVDIQQR